MSQAPCKKLYKFRPTALPTFYYPELVFECFFFFYQFRLMLCPFMYSLTQDGLPEHALQMSQEERRREAGFCLEPSIDTIEMKLKNSAKSWFSLKRFPFSAGVRNDLEFCEVVSSERFL